MSDFLGHFGQLNCIPFNGIQLIKSPYMAERKLIRMCRSKKKRIIKKWIKNPKNYTLKPMNHYIYNEIDRTIIAHPKIIEKLIKSVKERS